MTENPELSCSSPLQLDTKLSSSAGGAAVPLTTGHGCDQALTTGHGCDQAKAVQGVSAAPEDSKILAQVHSLNCISRCTIRFPIDHSH